MTDRDGDQQQSGDGERTRKLSDGERMVMGAQDEYDAACEAAVRHEKNTDQKRRELSALEVALAAEERGLGESREAIVAADHEVTKAISRALYIGDITLERALEMLGDRITIEQSQNLVLLMDAMTPNQRVALFDHTLEQPELGTLKRVTPYFRTYGKPGQISHGAGLLVDIDTPDGSGVSTLEASDISLDESWLHSRGLFVTGSSDVDRYVKREVVPDQKFDLEYFRNANAWLQIADWLGHEVHDWQREQPAKAVVELITCHYGVGDHLHMTRNLGRRHPEFAEEYDREARYIAEHFPEQSISVFDTAAEVLAVLRTRPEQSKFIDANDEAAILDLVAAMLHGSEGPVRRYDVANLLLERGIELLAAKDPAAPEQT